MFFCENCGKKLPLDARFCENCGHPVPQLTEPINQVNDHSNIYLFSEYNWRDRWGKVSKKSDISLGILLTNTKKCSEQSAFRDAMEKYIAYKAGEGIFYFVLDMANEKVCQKNGSSELKDVLDVLKQIYRVFIPTYLMIVGDRNVIASAKWENGARDSDQYVDSDLPYMTLDMTSPWEGQRYHFEQSVCVARIPSSAQAGFIEACTYFRNTMEKTNHLHDSIYGFSLSAEIWDPISRKIHTDAMTSGIYFTSPPKGVSEFDRYLPSVNGKIPNLLYFNLHGSRHDEFWYGQIKSTYPTAFSPKCLKNLSGAYMIGTEACYGAKPVLSETESMLSTALKSGCLAFLGSSQIAYGQLQNPAVDADIIVGEYLKNLSLGETAGNAYRMALAKLHCARANDTNIKTMAEFALYGDPSAAIISSSKTYSKGQSCAKERSIYVSMPDVRRAVQLRLAKVSAEIAQKLSVYVKHQHPEFANITPSYYEVKGLGGYQAIYEGKFRAEDPQILKVYFDDCGTVTDVYVSK